MQGQETVCQCGLSFLLHTNTPRFTVPLFSLKLWGSVKPAAVFGLVKTLHCGTWLPNTAEVEVSTCRRRFCDGLILFPQVRFMLHL